MPLLHLSARHSAQEAHDLVAAACAGRDRVWGVNGLARREPSTESERHQLAAYPASPLLPRVVRVRYEGQP